MTRDRRPGRVVRVYLDESDQWHGKTLYSALVQEAKRQGLAGATVVRGIMGYGIHHEVREMHLFQGTANLPVVVEMVDTEEAIDAFLPRLEDMVHEGLVTTSAVEVVTYAAEA